MDKAITMSRLVRQAGMGDAKSMDKLVETTRPILFSYLYRLTMDYHLAEDLLQQVQTEMVMSLWRLQKPDRFWPWIYKHAWGMVQRHYRELRKRREVSLTDVEQSFIDDQLNTEKVQKDAFFENIDKKQLFDAIYQTLKKMTLKQRTILTMRCYNDMTFHEIAETLDCSETNARVSFFRARKHLKRRLRREGYRSNMMFLPALGLFGTITSKSSTATTPAIVTVSEATTHVGFLASMIGTLTSKLGIFLMSVFSSLLAWFTFAHAVFIGAALLILTPFIIGGLFMVIYDE